MLVARATSKQVITTLNHMGVCLSYSQTFSYVENAAKAIEQNRELQHGDWIVAYDNIILRNVSPMREMPDIQRHGTSRAVWLSK